MKIEFKWWKAIGLFLLIAGWKSLLAEYSKVALGYIFVGIILMYIERKPTEHNYCKKKAKKSIRTKNRLKKQLYFNLIWITCFFIMFWLDNNIMRLKVFSTMLILIFFFMNSLVIWGEM